MFSGSHADLEDTAEQLNSSPRPQPLRFDKSSIKTPRTVPPTPGMALQNRIESKLEKILGANLNIQLQQQMGVFQASMLEAMQSLRDKFKTSKKSSEAGWIRSPLQIQSLEQANKMMTCHPTQTQNRTLNNRTSKHPNTHMNPWRRNSVVLLFLLSSDRVFSP